MAWAIWEALYNLAIYHLGLMSYRSNNTATKMWSNFPLVLPLGAALVAGQDITTCPGYSASNVQQNANGLTADLTLAGEACNAYGTDLPNLTLTVEYQSGE